MKLRNREIVEVSQKMKIKGKIENFENSTDKMFCITHLNNERNRFFKNYQKFQNNKN